MGDCEVARALKEALVCFTHSLYLRNQPVRSRACVDERAGGRRVVGGGGGSTRSKLTLLRSIHYERILAGRHTP
eukprot:6654386-Prymnesium_polylepis.1